MLISPLKAVSILNQCNLIRKLLALKGYDSEYKSTISIYDIRNPDNIAFLWVTLATSQFVGDAVFPYLYANDMGKPVGVYVTIEGLPTRANIVHSNLPRLEFIANSLFTATNLRRVGLKVIDVVHHAIDPELSEKAMKEGGEVRKWLESEYPGKVKFLYVGRDDPRKALSKLAEATRILKGKRDDFVVLLVTNEGAREKFKDLPVRFLWPFGSQPFKRILSLMAGVDYLVFPSVCEGFGLPVLEANSVATPVVHCWFPPLSEFSSKEFNFVFNYEDEVLVRCGRAQYWIFHDYPPEWLAGMMDYAIEVKKNDPGEYEDYRVKARRHAEEWDYRKVYPRLLKHLKVE